MTVCSFFLQGRCRYGDKCWNEHPEAKGGGGGGGGGDYRGNQQSNRGGFGNRVWINPSQRTGGGDYIQASTFSRGGGNDWNRGGGTRDTKSSDFSFSTQNRFSALNTNSNFDKGGQNSADDNAKHVETIQQDMESWQISGQWPFSCYSVLKTQISGFVELSPEELRLEYYTSSASGDLQAYENSVQQLANQWRSRVQELQTMSSSTQISVISELNNSSSQTSSHGFGSSGFGFSSTASGIGTGGFGSGSQSSSTFSFATPGIGFGASNTQQASGFSSTSTTAQPSTGFGSSAPSAASFSFAAPDVANKPSTGAFGSATAFSFKSPSSGSSAGGFGSGFGSAAPAGGVSVSQSSGSLFGGAAGIGNTGNAADNLFTAQSDLTPDELKEFTAKRFTLGQIPLKPPPADLLMV
ncbi:LOW QUALITY PROTEIN: nucleoporin NUP42 [Myxocyprinus asiaticus]|uniref:LOW QUALITY PROTEIN: nucleoporin NUP42 n=1 Tax=Myxocyprinus asiaticus TaxID=70543 RepID=UPI0022235BAE|nr:LOW QUALITY PROTEIN: nucleoporin NUP42 [Myxocyprinus asiaticus]